MSNKSLLNIQHIVQHKPIKSLERKYSHQFKHSTKLCLKGNLVTFECDVDLTNHDLQMDVKRCWNPQ